MGAVIRIDGVNTRSAVKAFGATVSLLNNDLTGVTSQKWEAIPPTDLAGTNPDYATNWAAWTVNPDGTLSIDQVGVYPAVTFTIDVTGGFEFRLTAQQAPNPVSQTAKISVRDVFGGEVPATAESNEANSLRGWSDIRNRDIKLKNKQVARGGRMLVANLSGGSLARGHVVRLVDFVDAHTITPSVVPGGTTVQPERVPSVVSGNANDAGAANSRYAVLDETIANNATGFAVVGGVFEGGADVDYSGFAAGAPIYVSNTGTQSATPGATAIVIGHVIKNAATTGAAFVQLAGGGGSSAGQTISAPGEWGSSIGTEEVVAQLTVMVDMSDLPATIALKTVMEAQDDAGTCTIKVRVGGTFSGLDGTVVGSTTANSPTFAAKSITGSIANPGGIVPVKVSITSSANGVSAAVRGVTHTLK